MKPRIKQESTLNRRESPQNLTELNRAMEKQTKIKLVQIETKILASNRNPRITLNRFGGVRDAGGRFWTITRNLEDQFACYKPPRITEDTQRSEIEGSEMGVAS